MAVVAGRQALKVQEAQLVDRQRDLFARRREIFDNLRALTQLQSQTLTDQRRKEVAAEYRELEQTLQTFDEQDLLLVQKLTSLWCEIEKQQSTSTPQSKKQGIFHYLFSEVGLVLWVLAAVAILGLNFGGAIPLAGIGTGAAIYALFIAGVAALAFFFQDSFALFLNMKRWGSSLDNVKWGQFFKNNAPALGVTAVTGIIAIAATLFVIFPPAAVAAFFATAPVIGGMSALALGSTVFGVISGIGFFAYHSGKSLIQKMILKKKRSQKDKQGPWEKRLVTFSGLPIIAIGTVAAAFTFFSITLPLTGGVGILPALCAAIIGGGGALSWLSQDGNSVEIRLKEMGQWLDKTNVGQWIAARKWAIAGAGITVAAMAVAGVAVIFPPAAIAPVIAASGLPAYIAAAVAACTVYVAARVIVGGLKGARYALGKLLTKKKPVIDQKVEVVEAETRVEAVKVPKDTPAPLKPASVEPGQKPAIAIPVFDDVPKQAEERVFDPQTLRNSPPPSPAVSPKNPSSPVGSPPRSPRRRRSPPSPKRFRKYQPVSAACLAESLSQGPLRSCAQAVHVVTPEYDPINNPATMNDYRTLVV